MTKQTTIVNNGHNFYIYKSTVLFNSLILAKNLFSCEQGLNNIQFLIRFSTCCPQGTKGSNKDNTDMEIYASLFIACVLIGIKYCGAASQHSCLQK